MRKSRICGFFWVLAAVFALMGILLAAGFRTAEPVVLKLPEGAAETADAFMTAVCRGEYGVAQGFLEGNPDLGADYVPEDAVSRRVWEAYLDSLDYRLEGACYGAGSGLAQQVTFLSLDLNSVTENLGERAAELLAETMETAADSSEIYGENNDYRPELVEKVLMTVTEEAIREDAEYVEKTLILELTCRDGQWYVVPEQQMLNVLLGGIS